MTYNNIDNALCISRKKVVINNSNNNLENTLNLFVI